MIIILTPFVPLSFKGEGEGDILKGRSLFNLPFKGRGENYIIGD